MRIAINVSKSTATIFARAGRHFIRPRTVTLFGETIHSVVTTRYLRVTLDIRLTRSPYIDQIRKKTAQKWVCWVPYWRGRVISPSGTESCRIRSSSIPSFFALLLVPLDVRNRQIHEDLGVPLFADLIRALTASYNSKLADVWNPVVRQLGRYLR